MSRLIDADELKEELINYFPAKPPYKYTEEDKIVGDLLREVRRVVDEQPTTDVKHGVWEVSIIEADSEYTENTESIRCSMCGHPVKGREKMTVYCPDCGSRMDGEK